MRAVVIHQFGDSNQLQLTEVEKPTAGEGEVLVKIKAIGVNPVDWKIRNGKLKDRLPHQFPLILGWDMAGVVEEVGHAARRFQPGDEVYAYCRRPVVQAGTYAEYIALSESYLTYKPKNLSFEESAAIPLASLTAYQSIYTAADLQVGENLLVLGASGGVGSFAVQLGKAVGANVIGVASEQNHAYLKELGVDAAIDYRQNDFVSRFQALKPQGAEVIFDCVGQDMLQKAPQCLAPGGRLVSIAGKADENQLAERQGQSLYVFVEPHAPQLDHIRELIETGQVKVHLQAVYPLEEVRKAHAQSEQLHTQGKIVLTV